jgi:ubiquinone/menaquinone biosynthesis C-methylase UbiE
MQPVSASQTTEPSVVPVREGYDLWSRIYDEEDNPLLVLETDQVRRLLGNVRGLRVADIGCGTGRHAVAAAEAGATVIGVDFSPGMLSKAAKKPGAAAVRFVHHDLAIGLPFASKTFDRVTCCLVLDHIVDLDGLLREMARICREDGFAVISVMHPAMMLIGRQAEFADPASGRKVRPASPGHQIADYVMAITRAGFLVEHMSEHVVDAELTARSERAKKYIGWPLLLLMRLRHARAR